MERNVPENSAGVNNSLPGFDLEALRLNQSFDDILQTKKLITTVPLRKPDRQWFFRVRPGEEWRITCAVLEFKESRETYIVPPAMVAELQSEASPRLLLTCVNRQGTTFLWPVRLPGADGRSDHWTDSAIQISRLAENSWCRLVPNMSLGAYEVFQAAGALDEPTWPDIGFSDLVQVAFKGLVIDSPDHPAIKRLRGLV